MTVPLHAVIPAIARERDYQDSKYGPIETRPHTVGDWLVIIEAELDEAKRCWIKDGDDSALLEILQVAATAAACMQEHGVFERDRYFKPESTAEPTK